VYFYDHLIGFRGIFVIYRFQGYFGKFISFKGYFGLFKVSKVFW